MTAKHKGGLIVILGVGFFFSLPLMLQSTDEEKQHLIQNTPQMYIIQQQMQLNYQANDKPNNLNETQTIKENNSTPEQATWTDHVLPIIMQYDTNEHEAKSIAQWVWIYAQSQGLDPALILALITVESRFDPFATSVVGAQGLMQVMPFWKNELGSPQDDLFNISTNIRYGTTILKQYLNRYRNIEQALAAYNGSKGRLKYPNKIFAQIKRYQP